MLIEISFRPTFRLMYRLVLSELWSRLRFLTIASAVILVASVSLYIALSLMPASPEHPEKDGQARSLLVNGVPLPSIFFALYFLIPLWSANSVMKNPNFAGELSYGFAEGGIDVKSPLTNSHMSWAALVKAREISWAFILYPQNALGFLVPKQGFSSNADVEAVRELIRQNIVKSKLRK